MVNTKMPSDGRQLIHQLRKTRRTILETVERGKSRSEDVKAIKALAKIFEACHRTPDEIKGVRNAARRLGRIETIPLDHAMYLIELIAQCEQDIRAVLREVSGADFELLPEFHAKEQAFTEELLALVEEKQGQPPERVMDLTKELVYRHPGLYISEMHQFLVSRHFRDMSYSSVWLSVHRLQDESNIITIGGPQGKRRYCFPNPELLASREEYYGLPYALLGRIEEHVTDRFEQVRGTRLRDLFVVNSSSASGTLLIIDYHGAPELGIGAPIKSFGRLETFDYVVSQEGLDPVNGVGEPDVVLGLKVALIIDGEENEVWYDKAIETGKSLYANGHTW